MIRRGRGSRSWSAAAHNRSEAAIAHHPRGRLNIHGRNGQPAMARTPAVAIALALLGLCQCLVNAQSAQAAEKPSPAHWMQDHLDALANRPLKRLAMPAAHDAAMYVSHFPGSLGQTQDLTIYGQLSAGVRYFDLRPQWSDGKLFIHHGPIRGPSLDDVLDDVRQFAAEGHRELIILKFSHFEAFDDAGAYPALVKQIDAKLGRWLYKLLPQGKRLADVTLGEYVQKSPAILAVCDGSFPIDHPAAGVWVYRDWDSAHPEQGDLRVFDQYANSKSYVQMKADQFDKFESYDGKCKARPDVPCDLFLFSWTLTPMTNVRKFAAEVNPNLKPALAELTVPNRFGCVVNLLYTDYVDTAKATDAAIRLNEAMGK